MKQGPDGLQDFTHRVRELFRLPEDVDISLTFGCKEPLSGQHLKLEGIGAFDAAVHCASVAAAERQHKLKTGGGAGPGGSGGGSDGGASGAGSGSGGGAALPAAAASAAATAMQFSSFGLCLPEQPLPGGAQPSAAAALHEQQLLLQHAGVSHQALQRSASAMGPNGMGLAAPPPGYTSNAAYHPLHQHHQQHLHPATSAPALSLNEVGAAGPGAPRRPSKPPTSKGSASACASAATSARTSSGGGASCSSAASYHAQQPYCPPGALPCAEWPSLQSMVQQQQQQPSQQQPGRRQKPSSPRRSQRPAFAPFSAALLGFTPFQAQAGSDSGAGAVPYGNVPYSGGVTDMVAEGPGAASSGPASGIRSGGSGRLAAEDLAAPWCSRRGPGGAADAPPPLPTVLSSPPGPLPPRAPCGPLAAGLGLPPRAHPRSPTQTVPAVVPPTPRELQQDLFSASAGTSRQSAPQPPLAPSPGLAPTPLPRSPEPQAAAMPGSYQLTPTLAASPSRGVCLQPPLSSSPAASRPAASPAVASASASSTPGNASDWLMTPSTSASASANPSPRTPSPTSLPPSTPSCYTPTHHHASYPALPPPSSAPRSPLLGSGVGPLRAAMLASPPGSPAPSASPAPAPAACRQRYPSSSSSSPSPLPIPDCDMLPASSMHHQQQYTAGRCHTAAAAGGGGGGGVDPHGCVEDDAAGGSLGHRLKFSLKAFSRKVARSLTFQRGANVGAGGSSSVGGSGEGDGCGCGLAASLAPVQESREANGAAGGSPACPP